MSYVIWFVLSFLMVYLLYYFFVVRKAIRDGKKSTEVQYLIYSNKLDINKFSYRKFANVVGVVTSIDIAIVATIVGVVDGIVWQFLFGVVVVIPVIVLSFLLLGNYYKKKQLKDNSKELEKEKRYLEKKMNKLKQKENKKKRGRKK